MKSQIDKLKKLGFKKLPTLDLFLEVQHNKLAKSIDEYNLYDSLRNFKKASDGIPSPLDFINYDLEGVLIKDNVPIFKGWTVCKETSSETKKVAKLVTVQNQYRIYFDTADGVVIWSQSHVADKVKYKDLAYYFENELKLN